MRSPPSATPVGAFAEPTPDGGLLLRAYVGAADGSAWVTDELGIPGSDPSGGPDLSAVLGREVGRRLLAAGAAEVLGR